MIVIRLPPEVEDRLAKLEKTLGEYLADLEDYYIAEKSMADIRAGRSITSSLEEVVQELGLGD